MKKTTIRSGLMATTTICSAVLSTMMVPALVATVAVMLPASAEAQDYTSGAVAVAVTDPSGAPVAGATVTLTSQSQGIVKTVTTSASGSATATGLTAGEYNIVVTANGFDTYTGTATVIVSQQVTYTYSLTTTGGASTVVTVKGHRVRQDFNKTTAGLSVDLTTLTSQQAIGRTVEAVTMLAPTVVNSTAFGEPSIGGGSAAENAYYINGLNITNPDTYIGLATIPFDFYKTVDVQTSGMPAEFGRATGGVVNSTTKSGTNDFMFAVHGNYAPDSFRSTPFAPSNTTNPAKFRTSDANTLIFESGGALVKDKLFLYGLVQLTDTRSQFSSTSGGYLEKDKTSDPFYGLKADWYITSGQHVELTYFDTTSTTKQTRYAYTCANLQAATPTKCLSDGSDAQIDYSKGYGGTTKTGGPSWVAKYTGNVTDWLTISAAYGDSKYDNDFTSANPNDNYAARYIPSAGIFTRTSVNQLYSAGTTRDDWERKFTRGDADLRFEMLGKHHVRFGFDNEDLSMTKTTKLPGAQPIRYLMLPDYSYGYIVYENLGGKVSSKDTAYYIQDSWDITSTLNLQLGLRSDDFKNKNLSGEQFLSLTGNVAPRLGFSWKPSDDSKWRFTGSYGQEYIPPAMNLGFRGRDLYFVEYFYIPGYGTPDAGYELDANGLPTHMGDPYTSIETDPFYHIKLPCPASDSSSAPGHLGSSGGLLGACAVYGNGTQEPAAAKAALGLKATRSSEMTLGATYRANDLWTFGLTLVHRNLDRISEDTDFAPQINAYCASKGLSCNFANEYHVWNIGDEVTINTFQTLPDGSKQLHLTGLGFKKPTRVYDAATFDFKRAFDGKWGIQGSYTYSRSKGSYEGTVLSLGSGTGQVDAGSTQAYDYLGLTDNQNGIQANNRDHEFKVWGTYAITPAFSVGANVSVISPYYYSCYSRYPTKANPAYNYGHASHYCLGEAVGNTKPTDPTHGVATYAYVDAPVGHGGKSDWTKTIDLSMRYTLPATYSLGGKLVLRADIFNLLNDKEEIAQNNVSDGTQYAQSSDPTKNKCGAAATCATKSATYGTPTLYAQARYTRIGFDLSF